MRYSLDDLATIGISFAPRLEVADFTLDGHRFGKLPQVARNTSPNENRLDKRKYYEAYAVAHMLVALGHRRVAMFTGDKPDIRADIDGAKVGIEQVDILSQDLADAKHAGLDLERNVRDAIGVRPDLAAAIEGLSLTVSFTQSPKGFTKQLAAELFRLVLDGRFQKLRGETFVPTRADGPALFSCGGRAYVNDKKIGWNFFVMYGTGITPIAVPARTIVADTLKRKQHLASGYGMRPLWLFMTVLEAVTLTSGEVREVVRDFGSILPFDRLVVYSDAYGLIFA
jgi:hypothetical protein